MQMCEAININRTYKKHHLHGGKVWSSDLHFIDVFFIQIWTRVDPFVLFSLLISPLLIPPPPTLEAQRSPVLELRRQPSNIPLFFYSNCYAYLILNKAS